MATATETNTPPDLANGLISGDRLLSREALEADVARAAAGFAASGLGQGDCVAILMRNDIAYLVASLAAIRLGAYAVPLNWHFKADEIAFILADCGAKLLVAHADLVAGLDDAIAAGLMRLIVRTPPEVVDAFAIPTAHTSPAPHEDWDAWLARQSPYTGPAVPPTQSMIYTSGTTGRPKGVRRNPATAEQEKAIATNRRELYGFGPGARTLMPGPLYHSAPNGFALRAVSQTDVLVLMPKFEPEAFLALVEKHRITALFMVPTMFVRLLKLPTAVRQRYDISSLKFVMHAAAPCPPDVKRQMIEWWGLIVQEFYGATELGAATVIRAEEWLRKPGSVGRAAPGATLRILDDNGREVPQGSIGEVFARLDYYPDFDYHNSPDARAEIERDGLITCGDMGYIDTEGYLFLCDRKRDMVISGGVNIYPAEIEAAAIGMPGVKDCAVFGIPDAEFGEALMAIVEPMPGVTLVPDAVRAFLSQAIAGYKVPRRIEIQNGLPREDSGKIFKRRLREPYWQDAGRKI